MACRASKVKRNTKINYQTFIYKRETDTERKSGCVTPRVELMKRIPVFFSFLKIKINPSPFKFRREFQLSFSSVRLNNRNQIFSGAFEFHSHQKTQERQQTHVHTHMGTLGERGRGERKVTKNLLITRNTSSSWMTEKVQSSVLVHNDNRTGHRFIYIQPWQASYGDSKISFSLFSVART